MSEEVDPRNVSNDEGSEEGDLSDEGGGDVTAGVALCRDAMAKYWTNLSAEIRQHLFNYCLDKVEVET